MVSTSVELARETLDGKITNGIAKYIPGIVAHAVVYNSDVTTILNPILRINLLPKSRSSKVKFVIRIDRLTAGMLVEDLGIPL